MLECINFYDKKNMPITSNEQKAIAVLLNSLYKSCAQAKVSEYLDLNNYTQNRSVYKLVALLRSEKSIPFVFPIPLN
jgi:glutathionyl-hydroquinone reductase